MKVFLYPETNPIIFSLGPITTNWYGLWFEAGALGATLYCMWLSRKIRLPVSADDMKTLVFFGFLIILAGSRIGYVLANPAYRFSADPFAVLRFWEGGTSFYGGLTAAVLTLALYSYIKKTVLLKLTDSVAPLAFIAVMSAAAGDISNGVHWGSVSLYLPWAVMFPLSDCQDALQAGICPIYRAWMQDYEYSLLPRHPLQIYEFVIGGLFTVLLGLTACYRISKSGFTTGIFLIMTGLYKMTTLAVYSENLPGITGIQMLIATGIAAAGFALILYHPRSKKQSYA